MKINFKIMKQKPVESKKPYVHVIGGMSYNHYALKLISLLSMNKIDLDDYPIKDFDSLVSTIKSLKNEGSLFITLDVAQ